MADHSQKFLVLGAGASGLAVLKNLREAGIPCDCLERDAAVGGIWSDACSTSSVYDSTHLISSKRRTEFSDFPMPKEYPPFPSRRQAADYLRDYAIHFNLTDAIEFNTSVERIEPHVTPEGELWNVQLADGSKRIYRGIILANGHNWDPSWPEFSGQFDGAMLHARDYKSPDLFAGKRVLVVGAGNSGCDIAVEAATHATKCFLSMRRGYHFLPKFFRGRPIDSSGEWMMRWRIPLWARRIITRWLVKQTVGAPEDYGLPRPDHKLFETHPLINSQVLYEVGHGRIVVKGAIDRLCGGEVRFADGSQEPIDTIVCATGYRLSFPFIEPTHLDWCDGRPDLYLNVFHRTRDNLFVAGMIQPDSGQWAIVDSQAKLIARYLSSLDAGHASARRFQELKKIDRPDLSAGVRHVDSPRHLLEVEHFSYRRRLEKQIRLLS